MSIHDRWGGRRSGDGRRWEVRWRDQGQQRKRRFTNRTEAERWNARVTLRPGEGREVSVTVADVWADWYATKANMKPSYAHDLQQQWDTHVEPRWGHLPLSRLNVAAIQTWVGGLSPSTARRCMTVLGGITTTRCTPATWTRTRA